MRCSVLHDTGWLYPRGYVLLRPNLFESANSISKQTIKRPAQPIEINFLSSKYPLVCKNWYPEHARDNYIYTWDKIPKFEKKEVYVVQNSIEIKRVSDNAPIPAESISIRLDWNSFCWGVSFEAIGKDALDLIKPQEEQPVLAEATINEHNFQFYIERWNEQKTFGSDTYSVEARGMICELDEPYEVKQTYNNDGDTSAKQLCESILENTGWTIDWQIQDWLIKDGAFSIFETPIRAILRIISAYNAIAYGDAQNKILHVKERFKVKSWNLSGATPDLVVPSDAMLTLSQQYVPQKTYNGIYVIGTSKNAVGAFVKRSGTDGTPTMEQVQDDLFTDTVIALQRGTTELCFKAGAYYKTTIVIPVLQQIGELGDIIEYSADGISNKAIVTAISINAQRKGDGSTIASQTMEVLRW